MPTFNGDMSTADGNYLIFVFSVKNGSWLADKSKWFSKRDIAFFINAGL